MYHFKKSTFGQNRDSYISQSNAPSHGAHHTAFTPSLRSGAARENAHRYAVGQSPASLRVGEGDRGYSMEDRLMQFSDASKISHNYTMPAEQESTSFDVKRTGSGGLIMRKKTFEEKEEKSRARAQQLSDILEQSDIREDGLNKMGSVKHKAIEITSTPSFGSSIGPKEAARKFAEKEEIAKRNAMKAHALMTASEIRKAKGTEELSCRKDVQHVYVETHTTPISMSKSCSMSSDASPVSVMISPGGRLGACTMLDDEWNDKHFKSLKATNSHDETVTRMGAARFIVKSEPKKPFNADPIRSKIVGMSKLSKVKVTPTPQVMMVKEAANGLPRLNNSRSWGDEKANGGEPMTCNTVLC